MEALILIVGELLFAALAVVVTPLLGAIATAAALVGELLSTLLNRLLGRRKGDAPPPPERSAEAAQPQTDAAPVGDSAPARARATGFRAARRWGRRIALGAGAIALLAAGLIVAIEVAFFEKAVRKVFDTVERRHGLVTECARIDGGLVTGRLQLGECTLHRRAGSGTRMDLALDTFDLDLEPLSLFGTAHVERLVVHGLRGSIARPRRVAASSDDNRVKPRRDFEIDALSVRDVELDLSAYNRDDEPFALPVEIERLEAAPLRSRRALFDILFRASGRGRLAGSAFEFGSEAVGAGRQTQWRAEALPVAQLGAVTGGTLAWLHDGTVDVHIEDAWERGDGLSIALDWRLDFRGVRVAPPEGASLLTGFVSAPLVNYVNRQNGDFPLRFSLTLDENRFDYAGSLAAAGLWGVLGETLDNVWSLVLSRDPEPERARSTGDAIKDGVMDALDELRKRRDDKP